jgi:hypothetical protein
MWMTEKDQLRKTVYQNWMLISQGDRTVLTKRVQTAKLILLKRLTRTTPCPRRLLN